MSKTLTSFLDDVCIHISCKAVHKEVRDELAHHISDLTAEYIEQGHDEKSALIMAIAAMGNSAEIGNRLNKQHKPQTEWSLIGLVAVISIIGCTVMYASSKFESYHAINFERHLIYVATGVCTLIGFYFFDYTKLEKLAKPIYIVTLTAVIFTLFFGVRANGSKGWITLGRVGISPEYSTFLFVIAFAGFLEKRKGKNMRAILELLALAFISIFPIIKLYRLPQALILAASYLIMTVVAIMKNHFSGNKKIPLIFLGSMGIAFIAVCILSVPYRVNKVIAFFKREQYPGYTFLNDTLQNWLTTSKWLGKTKSTFRDFSFEMSLPDVTGEFVFVNIIASLGWIVGIIFVTAVGMLIIRMFITAKKISNSYGFYLSLAPCVVLSLQFVINILMNLNLFPFIGVSLPFVSYTGTGYAVSMSFVGIILSVWRSNRLLKSPEKTIVSNAEKFIKFEDGKIIINLK